MMNRILKRPMFRRGGSTGTGITSGLDTPRKEFSLGTDPYDRALKTTERFEADIDKFVSRQPSLGPGTLPGFLPSFGLNLASSTPAGTLSVKSSKRFLSFFEASLISSIKPEVCSASRGKGGIP